MNADYELVITLYDKDLYLYDKDKLSYHIGKECIGKTVFIENMDITSFDYGHNVPSHYGEMVYHKNVLFSVVKYETHAKSPATTYLKIESVL